MNNIGKALRAREVRSKTASAAPDELTFITVDLYPIEIVEAARTALGKEAIADNFLSMYQFGLNAQEEAAQITVKQMAGIKLTHRKVREWLVSINAEDIFDLDSKEIKAAYVSYHVKRMIESAEIVRIATLGGMNMELFIATAFGLLALLALFKILFGGDEQ